MRVSMPLQRARTSSPSASSPWRKRNSSSGGRRRSHEDFEDGPLHGLSAFLLKGSRAWSEPPPSLPDFVGPVLVRRTLDRRGRGLFATEDLDAGSLLLVSNPLAVSRNDPTRFLLLSKLISSAQTNPVFLRRVYALAHCHSLQNSMAVPSMGLLTSTDPGEDGAGEAPVLDPKRIMDIMMLNCFEGEFPSRDGQEERTAFSGLWLIPSLINHSCHRNASRLVIGDAMVIHAATDIKAGEEITITYVDALVPLQQRREASQAMKFGFICNCRRCAVEQSVEPLLRDASCRFCVLHKKAAFEVTNAITSRGSLPLDSAFPACTELSALFSSVHTSVASHDGLSDVERQWILSGYASAFLGMWLVSGYSTGFADSQRFVNRATLDVVHSIKTTMPGLLQTLSLIAHLIGIAQKMDGNEQLARELFDLGIEESLRVYGKRNLDVLTELIGKSLEVIPFF